MERLAAKEPDIFLRKWRRPKLEQKRTLMLHDAKWMLTLLRVVEEMVPFFFFCSPHSSFITKTLVPTLPTMQHSPCNDICVKTSRKIIETGKRQHDLHKRPQKLRLCEFLNILSSILTYFWIQSAHLFLDSDFMGEKTEPEPFWRLENSLYAVRVVSLGSSFTYDRNSSSVGFRTEREIKFQITWI